MNGMKVVILGGGAVALATFVELSLAGFTVNIFELPRFKENIQPIIKRGGIEFSGVTGDGFARLNMVTNNIEEALLDVDLIILTAPVFGHQAFIDACLPYFQDGQIFLTETAYFSCLRFGRRIQDTGKRVIMAEMNQSPYTCTKTGPAQIFIDAKRDEVFVASLPAATDIMKLLDPLKSIYPGMVPVPNVLQTSLDNINWIAHPPITLLHRGLIERTKEFTLPLKESLPPSVIRLMEVMDRERRELGKVFGLNFLPIKHTFEMGGETLEEALRRSKEFETFGYKYENGSNAYLMEDLYYALPPLASLASLVKVPTPTINAMIQMFSVIDDVDYIKEGLNVEKMGLDNLSIKEILKLVEEGF